MAASLAEHLEKLRYFAGIADRGSLSQAASHFRITQPTLSHALRVLEETVGARLFTRSPRGVQLTGEGKRLYAFASKLLAETAAVEGEIGQSAGAAGQAVVIGTKEPLAVHRWPGYLAAIRKAMPDLRATLAVSRSNAELVAQLRANKVDMLLIPDPPEVADLVAFEIFRDDFAVYSKPGGATSPLFVFGGALCGKGRRVGEVLAGLDRPDVQDVDSFEVALSLTLSGLGSSLLPRTLPAAAAAGGQLTATDYPGNPFGELAICLCTLDQSPLAALLRPLARVLRDAESGEHSSRNVPKALI